MKPSKQQFKELNRTTSLTRDRFLLKVFFNSQSLETSHCRKLMIDLLLQSLIRFLKSDSPIRWNWFLKTIKKLLKIVNIVKYPNKLWVVTFWKHFMNNTLKIFSSVAQKQSEIRSYPVRNFRTCIEFTVMLTGKTSILTIRLSKGSDRILTTLMNRNLSFSVNH